MIKVRNLSFGFGEKLLFDKVDFSVAKNQKVGLVGSNGAGKTTLLNLLSQKEFPVEGEIEVVGSIGFVPQEVKTDFLLDQATSVRQYLDPNIFKKDFELKKMLANLELGDLDLEKLPKVLSGGQKTKLALCRVLLLEPDLLLLDEPTNFMDLDGKKWVMDFLSKYPKTLILISHDLDLIDQSIDRVLYLNQQTKKIDQYKGNYTKFLQLKKEKEDLFKKHLAIDQKKVKNMEQGVVRLFANTSKKGVRQRVILQKRLERLKQKLPELPPEIKKIKLFLPLPLSVGEIPIKVSGISKAYGSLRVFNNLDFLIVRGERIALLGPNGSGKSTLVKILNGVLEPDKGAVIRDKSLKIGYYSQEFEVFDLNKTLLETLTQECQMAEGVARSFLGRFNFIGSKVFQKVATLSGGEKTRLAIALLTGNNHNLLILDEPTTYLDVLSQRIILDALKQYQGTMLFVSHTEEFVKELNPDKVFLMPEGKMAFWSDELGEKADEV